MTGDLLWLMALSGTFLVLFGLGELGYRFAQIQAEYTRKFIHAGTGIITLLFPILFSSHWSVLAICSSFLIILLISYRWNILPSINAIDRFSLGSVLYPVTVYLLFLNYNHSNRQLIYFYLPILILAFADPAAALCGKNWPIGKYKIGKANKTLLGSISFAITAFTFCCGLMFAFNFGTPTFILTSAFVIACVTSFAEAISGNGWDNLSIPMVAAIMLLILDKN